MAGQRQPIDLLLIKGNKNLTKKEIEERKATEVKAPSDKVKPPAYLPSNLKREFKKIADELMQIGIMTNLDVDALARFLIAKNMYVKISNQLINLDPLSQKFETLIAHQDKFFKQSRQSAMDLGLTISSRCKLVIPKNNEAKEKTASQKRFGDRL
ncbi:phage terminase small subunit P27 family [Bacillus sp. UNCCL81]|uniref:phage terminase small subunit P27 family n=1 Tax=Bacillus sp. UNCCL81 TaxID=1502755 RepID=UPI0008EC5850|nr:phage terminase small subunit P27 family [Bacillus sp. UNCCL81]SFC52572.1 phage terminase, small subunit, putative, P27 family [Bacillus sp. UNCCL81]